MSVNEPLRQQFRVVLWSSERSRGAIVDRQGVEYAVSARDLMEGEVLGEGDIVTGVAESWDRVSQIRVDVPAPGHEREQFESAGPDQPEGWEPRGTPWKNPGTPHDGRFSHGDPQPKK